MCWAVQFGRHNLVLDSRTYNLVLTAITGSAGDSAALLFASRCLLKLLWPSALFWGKQLPLTDQICFLIKLCVSSSLARRLNVNWDRCAFTADLITLDLFCLTAECWACRVWFVKTDIAKICTRTGLKLHYVCLVLLKRKTVSLLSDVYENYWGRAAVSCRAKPEIIV